MAIIAALIANGGIELASTLSAADVAATINAAETSLRTAVPAARVVYLEPDIRLA